MRHSNFISTIVCLLLFGGMISSQARAQDDAPNWGGLTDEQRQVLEPFEADWDNLPDERRLRLAEGARRWSEMDATERRAAQSRFRDWKNLQADRRAEILERYRQFQRLSPVEKARIRNNFRRFNDLPADRRQQLRDRFRSISPAQRQAIRERLRNRQIDRPRGAADRPRR